jgi:hypothetical protein
MSHTYHVASLSGVTFCSMMSEWKDYHASRIDLCLSGMGSYHSSIKVDPALGQWTAIRFSLR